MTRSQTSHAVFGALFFVALVGPLGCSASGSATNDDQSGLASTGGAWAQPNVVGSGGSTLAGGSGGIGGFAATGGQSGGSIGSGGAVAQDQGSGGFAASSGSGGQLGGGGGQVGSSDAGSGSGGTGTGGSGAGDSGTGGSGVADAGPFNPCPTNGDACKVLPFGDSITFGVGSDAQGGGGYRVELFNRAVTAGKKLAFVGTQMNGPAMVAGMPFPQHHAGYNGYTVAQITDPNLFNGEVATAPNIVLLHIGTNDMYRADGGSAPQRLATLVDDLTDALPNALIVVAKIIPLLNGGTTQVNTYNAAIAPLIQQRIDAGKHLVLVDQNTGFMSSDMSGDNIHPNVMGYQRMAGVWYDAIDDLLP